jgi:hypothetical protein
MPPAPSTRPEGSIVAVCPARELCIDAAGVHLPIVGPGSGPLPPSEPEPHDVNNAMTAPQPQVSMPPHDPSDSTADSGNRWTAAPQCQRAMAIVGRRAADVHGNGGAIRMA